MLHPKTGSVEPQNTHNISGANNFTPERTTGCIPSASETGATPCSTGNESTHVPSERQCNDKGQFLPRKTGLETGNTASTGNESQHVKSESEKVYCLTPDELLLICRRYYFNISKGNFDESEYESEVEFIEFLTSKTAQS